MLLAALLALAAPALAQDDDDDTPLAGQVGLWAGHARSLDPDAVGGMTGLTEVGAHGLLLGFDGGRTAGVLDLGMGWGGAFAWHGSFQFGPGGWIGERFGLSLTTGMSLGSVHRRVPAAFRVPIRASVVAQVARPLRVELFAEPSWIPNGNNARKAGGTTVPFLDEWRGGALFYFGHPGNADSDDNPTRFSLGVTVEEVMGTRILGARIQSALVERPRRDPVSFTDYPALEQMIQEIIGTPVAPELPAEPEVAEVGFDPGPLCPSVNIAWVAKMEAFAGTYPASARFEVPMRERPWWGADAEVTGSPGGPVQVTGDVGGHARWTLMAGVHGGEGALAATDAAVLALADTVAACKLPGSWVRDEAKSQDGSTKVVLSPFPNEGEDPWQIVVRSVDWAAEGAAPERAVLLSVRRASDTSGWNR